MNYDALRRDFKTAYHNLRPHALIDSEALSAFRVAYSDQTLLELVQLLEDGQPTDTFILSGSRGCGKSTLLAELCQRLKAANYFTVFFSAAAGLERADMNPTILLFALTVQLMLSAEKAKVPLPKMAKEQIYKWFVKRTGRTAVTQGATVNGVKFLQQLQTALMLDLAFRDVLTQEFQNDFADLLRKLDEIAAFIEAICSQNLLVIVDDLNKFDLLGLRELFSRHLKTFTGLSFRMIYTLPSSLLGDRTLRSSLEEELQNRIVSMPVAALFPREALHRPQALPNSLVLDTLIEMLRRRVPIELATAETVQRIVLYSGGNLAELMRIARECCRLCLVKLRDSGNEVEKINDGLLNQAIENLMGDDKASLGRSDMDCLKRIHEDCWPQEPGDKTFLALLHDGYVVEYWQQRGWYGLRPIVVEVLQS